MYLIVGTPQTEKSSKILSEFLNKNGAKNTLQVFGSIKESTLFIEKEWEKYTRVIFLDEDAIFPFMYLSKVHKLVVATITDVYSAYMTPLHNNTKVIIIPTNIIADNLICKLSKYFIDAKFEAGRHMVRIDMLDKETQ